MGVSRGAGGLLSVLAMSVVFAGCGSSSSSQRATYAREVSAQLKTSNVPSDLSSCVGQQAEQLPLGQLKSLATAGNNPPAATKQLAVHLVVECISKGSGIAALHALIAHQIVTSGAGTLPPAYTNCVVAKANATTAAQLSQLISAYASADQATAEAQAHQVGVNLGIQCVAEPAVLASLRAIFIASFKRGFASAHYSVAFQNCLLRKVGQVPASLLKESALNPSGAQSAGEALGRRAAHACLASGVKP